MRHREQRGHQDARAPLMPCRERCDTTGRLVDDEFATLIGECAARLKQNDRCWIVEPGAQRIGNAFSDLGVARHPHDTSISGECCAELRLCRMGNMDERRVALR